MNCKTYVIIILVLSIMFTLNSCGDGNKNMNALNEENRKQQLQESFERSQKAFKKIEQASAWIIQEGINTEHERGSESYKQYLENTFNVLQQGRNNLWDGKSNVVTFRIFSNNVDSVVTLHHREIINGVYYEYWSKLTGGRKSTKLETDYTFYVARADAEYGVREILAESKTFIETYTTDSIEVFNFPINDNYKVFRLHPHDYDSEAFIGTSLEGVNEHDLDF